MQVIEELTKARLERETVATVGAFDGVHLGHQELVAAVVKRARMTNRLAALVTFHPHPAAVLAPERAPRYLTSPAERAALLECLGIDALAMLSFDQKLARSSAGDFMQRLVEHLRLGELWIGPDFALGRGRAIL